MKGRALCLVRFTALVSLLLVACTNNSTRADEAPAATRTATAFAPSATPAQTAVASDDVTTDTFRDEALGVEFQYPGLWTEGAPGLPYISCFGCLVVGPADAVHPYGLVLFTEPLSQGCGATCYVGNRALPMSEEQSLIVAERQAKQVGIERQAPLGLASETGDYTPYREIWTLVPDGDRALFLVAFYRSDDTFAEDEAKAAYEDALASLAFLSDRSG